MVSKKKHFGYTETCIGVATDGTLYISCICLKVVNTNTRDSCSQIIKPAASIFFVIFWNAESNGT